MSDFDRAECERLIAQAREDDERMERHVVEWAVARDELRWCRPGYLIHRSGVVMTARSEGRGSFPDRWTVARRLQDHDNGKGYRVVNMRIGGRVARATVHSLVAETYLGPRPDGMEVRHLNGVRHDNRVENLAWGTILDNREDSRRHGTLPFGERNGQSKLTEDDVRAIRDSDESQTALGERFGVNQSIISQIKRRVRWRHVV